ncbi:MAG TPA: isoleucine--tRNA ligase, partial [Ferruginibacter sp.]|nr:isoleucine--tRNA ligase [Ferruginibacter sp.]HRQ19723.1 isoleucine--tRNA ligase [Ferruginibacter sp.]
MSAKYPEYTQLNLPSIAETMLEAWKTEHAFEKSIELRAGRPSFVFYEGPPSANGMPGIHHVISRTLKDLVCRYKTMQGFQVKRKGGWDTHGLPVELGVEKELGITKEDIGVKITVEEYNARCREAVMRYKSLWDDITQRMGYWVDLKEPYVTFENNYIESLWWCLSRLYEKGYLYQSVSIQPYSPAAGTGLSSHELNQPGTYKDVKDTSAVVMFKAIAHEQTVKLFEASGNQDVFFMAWTTTPWTLPSNLGLTVGPDIEYSLVRTFNPYTGLLVHVVLATALLPSFFKAEQQDADEQAYKQGDKSVPWRVLLTVRGSELAGARYEQLLPFESNTLEKIKETTPDADPFRIITGDFVTTEDGTGIVHTAPAFGADDFKVGKQNRLGILTLVDREGKFIEGTGEFSGRFVKNYKDDAAYVDVNVDIAVKLKLENRAFKVEKYEHNYPHCWRTDKPIIYYPLDAWFIKTTAVKDRMIELNKTIRWKPASTGSGRFGNWLENMVDWNLSRSRYWGTPLPIWKTEDGEEMICIGSIRQLNDEIQKAHQQLNDGTNAAFLTGVKDLHKPFVDEIVLVSNGGKRMYRVPDLIDVWFDSGAMPYAQWHYPFENEETFKENFPADFIAEGVDQTRGWFYTLHALGVLLFDSVAYKTVVSNGLVLDKHGNKMSKRLGNVVDPFSTLDQFGADATRWYLITNASPWDSLKFDAEGIREIQRKFFGTLYNTYQFFVLYANVDGFRYEQPRIPENERPEMDRWILSSLHSLIQRVTGYFDDYEPTQAGRDIETFVDVHLSNWYVRLCRRRFWKGEYEADKISAYQTLYECLETLSALMAPIAPFFADWMFRNLNQVTGRIHAGSIHHVLYPVADAQMIDQALEKRMELAQDASSLILSLRKKVNIKVRQPLQKAIVPALDKEMAEGIRKVEHIIMAETNIKEIEILDAGNDFIRKKAKANFKSLGKKLGPKMKLAANAIEQLTNEQINQVQNGGLTLTLDNDQLVVNEEDIEIFTDEIPGYEVASKGSLTVALDITLTENLLHEGNARELVNRIQNVRKDLQFELTDRISVKISQNEALQPSLIQFKDY